MAFDLKYLTRLEQTEVLDKTTNPISGMDTQSHPSFWMFNGSASGADDTITEIDDADYFLAAYGYLSVGDAIWCVGNNGAILLAVATSAVGGVTTTLKSA
jgi:hypothetical protein